MAHKRDYKPEDILFPNQVITESELVGEMQRSYIDYAMSVIVGRALPDVRDGLKPVHRRILYTMYESGLTSDKAFKKSATCVGDVLGHYHPHGDASVYDAMVRLAQDFSMRYMLVDGHGNFGSVDGDPPAAYRYTEARLSKISNEMLRDIEKDTVDWDPNFDESRKEPRVLPSRFPNLLVNGSSGIAVGMATNIPPHNLSEVINACVCVLDNPEAELSDLMQCITGPDFPTKGIIMGRSGIRQAYATGRGKIIMRARTEFEEFGQNRTRIIVTELPYQVNKRQLIRNIADQVHEKRLEGISDLRDHDPDSVVLIMTDESGNKILLNREFRGLSYKLQDKTPTWIRADLVDMQEAILKKNRSMNSKHLEHKEKLEEKIEEKTGEDTALTITVQSVLGGSITTDEIVAKVKEADIEKVSEEGSNLVKQGEKYLTAVIGNKCDLIDNEEISEQEGKKYAEEINAKFKLVSAKEDVGINNLFNSLVDECILQLDTNEKSKQLIITKTKRKKKKKKKCC